MRLPILLGFCLLLFSPLSFSKYPDASLSGPRDTFNFFLKTMKGHKTGDPKAIDLAIKSLDLSATDQNFKGSIGKVYSVLLINTIDRLEYVDIKTIPKTAKSGIWYFRKDIVQKDQAFIDVEISIAKDKNGKWKFSKKTLKTLRLYYDSLKSKEVASGVTQLNDWKEKIKNKFPDWTGRSSFILLNGQWLGILFVIFLALFLEKLIRLYIGWTTERVLKRKNVEITSAEKNQLTGPIGIMAFAGVWIITIRFFEFESQSLSLFLRSGYVVFTVGSVISTFRFVDVASLFFEKKARESKNKFDDILVPLVRKTAKFFVVSIGVIFIGDSLTLDMKSIIAGLGIGGLAFALAAKDTISNIFGSLTILLDKPFRIGDWVLINGKIEGTVEEVGMRSCRIRTFYDSQITLPNGQLTNAHIDNYGQRTFRRYSTKIGVQYDTSPEKIEAFCEGIRQIILNHKWTRKDYFHVYLNSFNNSSLDILVYVFWRVPDWSKELAEKHRLLLDILRLGNDIGIQFAFPTQTLHMFNEEKVTDSAIPPELNSHEYAKLRAESITSAPMSKTEHRSGTKTGSLPEDDYGL